MLTNIAPEHRCVPSHAESRPSRRGLILVVILALTAATRPHPVTAHVSASTPQQSANDRVLEPGPEARRLARRVGNWDVVMRLRPTPDGTPVVVRGIVAERRMIGLYLQERMEPGAGSDVPAFTRMEYLTFNPVEMRWQYVSLDTRAPVGLMPARSPGPAVDDTITVYFENSAVAGFGPEFEGRLFHARHVTTPESDDRDISRQYWTRAGGPEWLAVEYEYTRRR